MSNTNGDAHNLVLNAAIGFLSLLLFLLLFGLASRVIFPRIQSERSGQQAQLIGEVIQLEVLNGAGIAGLANDFTSALRRNGFDVVETGNFDNFDMQQTVVIARTLNTENARRVARALGISQENVLVEASDDFYLDATVVIGSDYQSLKLN